MFSEIYRDKKILITGNTGFKGSWLTVWLKKLGANIYGLSKDIPTSPSMFQSLNLTQKINYFEEDIRDSKKVDSIINDIKPDFIFHLAAQSLVSKSYIDPLETISTNVNGTLNVLESIRNLKTKCIAVFITSDKCYDNVEWEWGYREIDALGGKDIYSGSKGAAELIIKSYFHSFLNDQNKNKKISSARAGNVIGGGDWAEDRIVPDCIRSWIQNEPVEIRSPNSTRPWQHVLEPLSGYLSLGMSLSKNRNNGESFNFGPDSKGKQTVEELIKDLSKYWGYKQSRMGYKIKQENNFHEAHLLKLNCDKALINLDWSPTLNYEELINMTGLWYKEFYSKNSDMYNFTLDQINKYEDIASKKGLSWVKN